MSTTTTQITVVGNVGRDAECKKTAAKTEIFDVYDKLIDEHVAKPVHIEPKPFVTFSLAGNGTDDQTVWYSVTSWNPNTEVTNLRKGDRVLVRGNLTTHTYNDRNGAPRTELRIKLSELKIIRKVGKKQPQAA